MKIRGLILTMSLMAASTSVSAYSIDTHRSIMKVAVEEFNSCIDMLNISSHEKIDSVAEENLIFGNLHEDTNIFKKATGWHFHNPKKDLGRGTLWIGKGSLEKRFKELEKRRALTSGVIPFRYIGGMIHYIQDVTNPAHVAPVYHLSADGFDRFPFQQSRPEALTKSECDDIFKVKYRSPFDLVNNITNDTLATLNRKIEISKNGHPVVTTWNDAFWNQAVGKKSKQKDFGQYGFLGNNFGTSDIAIGSNNYVVEPGIYTLYAMEQMRKAINFTLVIFNNELLLK